MEENVDGACEVCGGKFTAALTRMRNPFLKEVRKSHSCRVCARHVCEVDGGGCSLRAKVPKQLWHRSLSSLRKEDPKASCDRCSRPKSIREAKNAVAASMMSEGKEDVSETSSEMKLETKCTCCDGWLCVDCSVHMTVLLSSTIFDDLDKAMLLSDTDRVHQLCQNEIFGWLPTLDCDASDDAKHFLGFASKVLRLKNYLHLNTLPTWPRPSKKQRAFTSQVAQSALEAVNFVAGGKIRAGLTAVKLAAQGYRFREYLLSQEFMDAWNIVLDQLGEFVAQKSAETVAEMEGNAGAEGGKKSALSSRRKAAEAFDICKRFYYYSLHRTLDRLKSPGSSLEDQPRESLNRAYQLLEESSPYLSLASLMYDISDRNAMSSDPDAEASWFLYKSMIQEGFCLIDHMPESAADMRLASQTFGAKCPSFALFLNREKKVLLLAIRGSKGKNDHLIDLDFRYDHLIGQFEEESCTTPEELEALRSWQGFVHRGMVKGARCLMYDRGFRSLLTLLPADYSIRLVGHSLGAGTVTLLAAMLLASPKFSNRDIKAYGFGMPACVDENLSKKLAQFVVSIIHRDDLIPRLSFNNLIRLQKHFSRVEERDWCKAQIDTDYENFWQYVGWSKAQAQKEEEQQESLDIVDDVIINDLKTPKNYAGDLVVPGQVLHLREDPATGQYAPTLTDYSDSELQWIQIHMRSISDHYMKAYLNVIRGMNLRARLASSSLQAQPSPASPSPLT